MAILYTGKFWQTIQVKAIGEEKFVKSVHIITVQRINFKVGSFRGLDSKIFVDLFSMIATK